MKQSRVAALLGPTFVLYLVASGASAGGRVDGVALVLAACALLTALAPLPALRAGEVLPGARRAALLGSALGAALAGTIWPGIHSLLSEVVEMVALPMAGALVLELSLRVPQLPQRAARRTLWLVAGRGLATGAAVAGVIAVAPPAPWAQRPWIAPTWLMALPAGFALACLTLATALRLWRRSSGSDARALAANLWPSLGCMVALAAAAAVVGLRVSGDGAGTWARGLGALAAVSLSFGHAWLADARRALVAGPLGRGVLSSGGTLGLIALWASRTPLSLPDDTFARTLLVLALVLAAAALRHVLDRLVRWVFAPQRGQLLDAVHAIKGDLAGASSFDDLAGRVLRPLRRALRSPEAAPLLFAFSPSREVRLDAAGQPRVRARDLPLALSRRLSEQPGAPILSDDLRALLVRRPELRELVKAMDDLDALAVLPLVGDGDLEGGLVVPRGIRRAGFTLEELNALESLAAALVPFAAIFSAQLRSQQRAVSLERDRGELEERLEQALSDNQRLRADAQVYKAGRAAARLRAAPVAYSPAMRALMAHLEQAAPHDVPVLLIAEAGTPLDQLGHCVHAKGGAPEGPLVVGDCGALQPGDCHEALFGNEQTHRPGWLRLAAGGTLLLVDLPSVPREVQRELAEALAHRKAHAVDGQGAYALQTRIVASARLTPQELLAAGSLDLELSRWFERTTFEVPALRERTDDVPSLVLLALDRAARVLGREVPGIHPDAMADLMAYDWPGNVRELQSVIDRAVARCEGNLVLRDDLPELLGVDSEEAFEGSFLDQEREILRRALERSGGNKSQTARALGLKRTTLLDKLRRHGLDDSAPRESGIRH